MKLNVPFVKQTSAMNCGPVVLKMILDYFGEIYSIKELEEKVEIKEGKGVSSLRLAITLAKLDYKIEVYSKFIEFNEENLKLDFYKKYSDNDKKENERKVKEARELGIKLIEKSISLEGVLFKLTKDSLIICLIDWNVIKGKEGYQGHFVPIVGYDKENVVIHNQGLSDTQEFMKIKREVFDRARKANGTDEDLIVVHRK